MVSKFGIPDGLCVRANAVLKGLLDNGHVVHAFTHSKNVSLLPPERIHRFSGFQMNPHLSFDAPHTPRTIAQMCRRIGIDLLDVQMNSGTTEFLLPLFKQSLPPLVVTYHLAYSTVGSFVGTAFNIAGKASLFASKSYDAIILVHALYEPVFLRNGVPKSKLHVIPNGVDTSLFTPRAHQKNDNTVDFIYVGRLSVDKGVHILIDAFREYQKENPMSRLTLIGDGLLKSMLTGRDQNRSIRWLGNVDHSLVPSFLKEADVFVAPMTIGPLTASLSVLEAMSCGLPVIAANVAGANHLLSPSEGLLVKPESVPAVVEGMRLLARDESFRLSLGKQCREKILREYSWKRQIGLIEDVYRQLIDHRSR